MATKLVIIFVLGFLATGQAHVVAAPAAYIAPYASSYSAHVVNHAIAAPVAAAPLVSAPLVAAAPAPYAPYPYASYVAGR